MAVKVGVISLGDSLGKSHLIATLAGVYSRSQQKAVTILSSGDIEDNIELVDVRVRDDEVSNPYILRAMLENSPKGDRTLFSYGIKQGNEEVYLYDVMSASMEPQPKRDFFIECLTKLPSDLTFVEICGDYDSDWNREIMNHCDCFLVMFDVSKKGLRRAANFRENEDVSIVQRTAFVLSRYDPAIIGEKKIHKTTNIPNKSMFQWPYNVQICKLGYDGILDQAAYGVIVGEGNLLALRERCAELMRFMFDTPTRKIIREVGKWSK